MSWLARSIANTLRLDDDDDGVSGIHGGAVRISQSDAADHTSMFLHPSEFLDLEEVDLEGRADYTNNNTGNGNYDNNPNCKNNDDFDHNQGRGVREDLSEFGETLTRQLWGVASFLAPPPPRQGSGSWLELDRERREVLRGSDSDDEEYETEGRFREFPQDFGHMEEEDDVVGEAVGITEEALAFAENIAHHPETWLDFPLAEEEEFDDFEISDSQHKHTRAIESLAPRLAALRIELCPAHLSVGYFWMVYFVLLHSRLKKHDADLLSTPQLAKARAMWMQELQKQAKPEPEPDWLGRDTFESKENIYSPREDLDLTPRGDAQPTYMSYMAVSIEPAASQAITDLVTEKHPLESCDIQFIDKSVIQEDHANKTGKDSFVSPSYKVPPVQDYDEDSDDWLENNSELEGYIGNSTMVNEEDVSFSDLEDDDIHCTIKSKAMPEEWTASIKTL